MVSLPFSAGQTSVSFLGELKRRNVYRVAGVYCVVGWLLVQVAASLEEAVNLPAWFDGVVVSFLAVGFPIALIFAWAFELTPDGIRRTSAVAEDESITALTGSRLDAVLVIALLLFAASIFLPPYLGRSEGTARGEADTEVAAAAAPEAVAAQVRAPDASIAVLPFADLSQAGDQEYFADGISEELLNVLAQVQGMKVAGRTSSFAFKGRNEDLREIGEILGVAHILEGSVRSQGDRVRVTAQLIQASDGFHLWSDTYYRDLEDIFAVQDDIAQKILVAMKERLIVDEAPAITPAARTDITAYNLFLEARDLIFTRNPEKMQRALELLNRAIEIDPAYAPAYASRAKALTLLSDRPGSYGTIPAKEALTRSRSDVERALQLDPELADGHAVMGLINADLGRPDFAVSSLRRALELNPNSLDARNWLALSLSFNGRLRDVAEQLKILVDIDPLYRPGVNNTAVYSVRIGDYETARRVSEKYIAVTDNDVEKVRVRATIYNVLERRVADSIKLRETLDEDQPLDRVAQAGLRWDYLNLGIEDDYPGTFEVLPVAKPYELWQRGAFDEALAMAESAIEEFPDFFIAHTVYVRLLAAAGRDDDLAAYFQREYGGDLETFATRLRPATNVEPPPYDALAMAMRGVGNMAMYEDAMQRWRFTIDMFRAGGDVSIDRDLNEAAYFSIAGDEERAIDLIEDAYEKGPPLSIMDLAGRPTDGLKDNPRFLALREKNLARINQEREILGFEPLTTTYYDRFKGL
jgi:TolB-like protein